MGPYIYTEVVFFDGEVHFSKIEVNDLLASQLSLCVLSVLGF